MNCRRTVVRLIPALLLTLASVGCALRTGSRPIGVATDAWDDPILGHVNGDPFSWRIHEGPDFEVYYGLTIGPRDCGVGFYLGNHSSFKPEAGRATRPGKLGVFDLTWSESKRTNPTRFRWEGLILYRTVTTKLAIPTEAKTVYREAVQ